jgi:NAD(P)-dependent dehydrogenase (short-subunit alcohol dehydrogenase family)
MSLLAPRFDQQTAIVTGAAQGIGLATAQRLRDEGATVHGFDLRIPDDEPGISWHEIDVTDLERWGQLVSEIAGPQGRIDAWSTTPASSGPMKASSTSPSTTGNASSTSIRTASSTDFEPYFPTWWPRAVEPSSMSRRCGA